MSCLVYCASLGESSGELLHRDASRGNFFAPCTRIPPELPLLQLSEWSALLSLPLSWTRNVCKSAANEAALAKVLCTGVRCCVGFAVSAEPCTTGRPETATCARVPVTWVRVPESPQGKASVETESSAFIRTGGS